MDLNKLSVVIITFNEGENIEKCLKSIVKVADEIIIVDSFSTDSTKKISEKYNVKFYTNKWNGYSDQKNYANSLTSYDYILSIDADEELSEELQKSILEIKKNGFSGAYKLRRVNNYCGKWIRYTTWSPDTVLRIWNKKEAEWVGNIHEHINLRNNILIKKVKGNLNHYSIKTIKNHLEVINKYSSLKAEAKFEKGTKTNLVKIIIKPYIVFLINFVIKGGFLDGYYGYLISRNSAYSEYLKYVKLKELYDSKNNTICFFNSTKVWGGGEKWHFDISNLLMKKGFNVVLAISNKSIWRGKVDEANIPYRLFSISNFSFINPFKIHKIKKFLAEKNICTVVINSSEDMKVVGLAAKWAGLKNIVYRRGSAIPIKNSIINRFFFNNIITDVLVNSKETKQTINKNNPKLFPKDKISIIYNGIDVVKFNSTEINKIYSSSENEIVIGNIGRIEDQKAQDKLIELAVKLKQKNIEFKILIGGDGSLLPKLKEMALSLNVADSVVFTGFVKDTKSFLESIDVFVLTSKWEGFGYVMAEAMICKKPVIAFDVSSNPEVVDNNKTGYLIQPFDIDMLAKKIIDLQSNKQLMKILGENGNKRAMSSFSIEKTIADVLSLRYISECK